MSDQSNNESNSNDNRRDDDRRDGGRPVPPPSFGGERPDYRPPARSDEGRPSRDDRPSWTNPFDELGGSSSDGGPQGRPPRRTSMLTALILFLFAFFVGSQMMTMMGSSEQPDKLVTSEFVQAVEQGRVENVVYDAGKYTVSGSYYPAATAGSMPTTRRSNPSTSSSARSFRRPIRRRSA